MVEVLLPTVTKLGGHLSSALIGDPLFGDDLESDPYSADSSWTSTDEHNPEPETSTLSFGCTDIESGPSSLSRLPRFDPPGLFLFRAHLPNPAQSRQEALTRVGWRAGTGGEWMRFLLAHVQSRAGFSRPSRKRHVPTHLLLIDFHVVVRPLAHHSTEAHKAALSVFVRDTFSWGITQLVYADSQGSNCHHSRIHVLF